MKVTDFCKSYFNGFQDFSNYKKATVFAVMILLGFVAVYEAASLYGRVSKKEDLSSPDKNVNDKAKETLLKKKTSVETSNRQLAEKIISARGEKDAYVKTICSGDFFVDPTDHLVREMIKRGVGRASTDDSTRSFIIGQIPGFIEKVSSLDYLRSFAKEYFEKDPNKVKIMRVFEKSLTNAEFQRNLQTAIKQFNGADAENSLRIPLTIYRQSAQLKDYSYPAEAGAE